MHDRLIIVIVGRVSLPSTITLGPPSWAFLWLAVSSCKILQRTVGTGTLVLNCIVKLLRNDERTWLQSQLQRTIASQTAIQSVPEADWYSG